MGTIKNWREILELRNTFSKIKNQQKRQQNQERLNRRVSLKTGGLKQLENVRVKRNEERFGKLWNNIKRASIQERPEIAKGVDTLH